jgi:hypothetical protein
VDRDRAKSVLTLMEERAFERNSSRSMSHAIECQGTVSTIPDGNNRIGKASTKNDRPG